jgi:hypothetical protein
MRKHLRSAIILGFAFGLVTTGVAQDGKGGKAPNYYPLQVGNKWHFRIETGGNTGKAVSTVAAMETIDGKDLARVDFSVDGKIVASEHLAQTDKGIFRHLNDKVAISPPIKLLQYPAMAGEKWKGDFTAGKDKASYACETAEENVTVPAGKFKALRVTLKVDAEEKGDTRTVLTSYWFVENIGFVKQTVKGENFQAIIELEKFEPAKK